MIHSSKYVVRTAFPSSEASASDCGAVAIDCEPARRRERDAALDSQRELHKLW